MLVQPTHAKVIDFWLLMPEIEKIAQGNHAQGHVRFGKSLYVDPTPARLTANNYFKASFDFPEDAGDFATCELIFTCDDRVSIILCLGAPTGFGSYKWKGVCPTTLKPSQILYFDQAVGLFVSSKAIGRAPPEATKRANDLDIVFSKLKQKYPCFSWRTPSVYPNLTGDPDFQPFNSVFEIIADRVIAENGLPRLVTKPKNKTDVIATISQARSRNRLPKNSLGKLTQRAEPRFKTSDEFKAYMIARGIPAPPSLKELPANCETKDRMISLKER